VLYIDKVLVLVFIAVYIVCYISIKRTKFVLSKFLKLTFMFWSSQNSGSESSSSLGSLFDSDNEETVSPLLSRREANQDIKVIS
jgi:hypothetical protein